MKLLENHYYHIYNRGINSRIIFNGAEDYQQFLTSYHYYNFLALDTFAYCLLNNHFHFLIRVRSRHEQKRLFYLHQKQQPHRYHTLKYRIFKPLSGSSQLGHLFNSYTGFFNDRYNKTGALLEGRFKRIEIDNQDYRNFVACYIHRNPLHHRLVADYHNYRWSSYRHFIKKKENPVINTDAVLTWFSGIKGFKAAHDEIKLKIRPEYLLE